MIDRIHAKRIVPVVVLDDAEAAEPLAEALLAGGLDIMEVTFRTHAAAEALRRVQGDSRLTSQTERTIAAQLVLREALARAPEPGS